MSEVKIEKHTFVYNGERYFRDKAEDVQIAAYGEKEDPLGTKASINVVNQVTRANLKGRVRDGDRHDRARLVRDRPVHARGHEDGPPQAGEVRH